MSFDGGTAMTIAERVRKHRERLYREKCRRLDVWIGADIIDGARQVAKAQKRPFWSIVEDALEACMKAHDEREA
jgi:hypothetical protein